MSKKQLIPTEGRTANARQVFFVRYFALVMTDLVVLNLFAEFWDKVHVNSFTASIIAAILLQALIKLTMALEHRVSNSIKKKTFSGAKTARFFAVWGILFGSKFVILWALGFFAAGEVHFDGVMHGIIPLIVVIVVMMLAEFGVAWFTDFLGDGPEPEAVP